MMWQVSSLNYTVANLTITSYNSMWIEILFCIAVIGVKIASHFHISLGNLGFFYSFFKFLQLCSHFFG